MCLSIMLVRILISSGHKSTSRIEYKCFPLTRAEIYYDKEADILLASQECMHQRYNSCAGHYYNTLLRFIILDLDIQDLNLLALAQVFFLAFLQTLYSIIMGLHIAFLCNRHYQGYSAHAHEAGAVAGSH